MAGLAIQVRVFASALLFQHICMASFASLMAGKIDGPRGDFGDCVSAVVAVLPKAFAHKKSAKAEEQEQADEENCRHPEQMPSVFEGRHALDGYLGRNGNAVLAITSRSEEYHHLV